MRDTSAETVRVAGRSRYHCRMWDGAKSVMRYVSCGTLLLPPIQLPQSHKDIVIPLMTHSFVQLWPTHDDWLSVYCSWRHLAFYAGTLSHALDAIEGRVSVPLQL